MLAAAIVAAIVADAGDDVSAAGHETGRSLAEAAPVNGSRADFGRCGAESRSLPVFGVRYVPHLVGEPYPHPESLPNSLYSEAYENLHERDLPLIGEHLAADALSLAPWPTDGQVHRNAAFFQRMSDEGLCKMIPTFHLAKYYADMLREGVENPRTDSRSALAVDFLRFGGTVAADVVQDVSMVAWTIDLTLDLEKLLPLVADKCAYSRVTQDSSFQKYMKLLDALRHWVHPDGSAGPVQSVAPDLQEVPLLIPLDLSRVSWTEPAFAKKLNTFLHCMSTSYVNGGWSTLFEPTAGNHSTRWLLSFALPPDSESASYDFRQQLDDIAAQLASERSGLRAIVMVSTQALKSGGANPINSVNLLEDYQANNARYTDPMQDYVQISQAHGNLDGFLYDEWMDDWDRGARGPFYLAAATLAEMQDPCPYGGRYSHDVEGCSRLVGSYGHVFPEYFGLAASSSQLLQHCVRPRFDEGLFSALTGRAAPVGRIPMQCSFMRPSSTFTVVAAVLLCVVAVVQTGKVCLAWILRSMKRSSRERSDPREPPAPLRGASSEPFVGYVTITPEDERLRGGHSIELQSRNLRSNEEVGWWLWTHVSAQMSILHKQVKAEVNARVALRARKQNRPAQLQKSFLGVSTETLGGLSAASCDFDSEGELDDLARSMQTVHRRVLEGFASWCLYAAGAPMKSLCRSGAGGVDPAALRRLAEQVESNRSRTPSRLFAEALLLRVMESLGEQILQCPERLSYLLYGILQEAGGLEDFGPATFTIDYERLHDGLWQMREHSNPYVKKLMSTSGKWERGLNFDDINESGIQCRDGVAKTYKEPSSVMVIVDFFLCYRIAIMLKVYALVVAGYLYLGSGRGDDVTTSHNGDIWNPKWLRINYLQYTAVLDALVWVGIELVLMSYVTWQRWPSLCWRSPGIPGLKWATEHAFNCFFSAFGGLWVWSYREFARKPWECGQSDALHCADPRSDTLGSVLQFALTYWVCRVVIFIVMNMKHVPIFLYGTPESKDRVYAGRGRCDTWKQDIRVNFAWLCMLGACIFVEVMLLLPSMRGLDWSTTCGYDVLGEIPGLPVQNGQCSEEFQQLSFGCVNCVASITAGWALVFLGSMVDIYFVFYFSSAVVGSVMGHKRCLNDLKNTTLPLDLRPEHGREAKLFKHTFGPGWQQIWRTMVKSLQEEALISPKQALGLVQAADIGMEGDTQPTRREKKLKQIHLTRYPRLAAERIAFFFQSLKWIENYRPGRGMGFEPSTDALTGDSFEPGTVPSLTQIIPAYNEVVIPSHEFLKAGNQIEDATNGSPDDQPGLGDLTVPPKGDGVNTNLAFMISQFPDEWVFLAKRLHAQGWLESSDTKDLYQNFLKQKLDKEVMTEVRLWAALRSQSVAKTVIGALQYGRALASLPKIQEYYRDFPEKRVPEDHVEVILAHQTYGSKDGGSRENDEAVMLMLERYCDEPLFLVFDFDRDGSLPEIKTLVNNYLAGRGGYGCGSFEHASVKCRWDPERHGLRILEVLPRMHPLRLGQGEFKTQGKACNQLNGLRFATGHYVQALDCNMGAFIGEGFKVPYVLRVFMPLDKEDRVAPRCRYLGFREYIFTGREGTVGRCHAAAEWTFGTIYQRFLSGMGMRMHYGHPDFLDGFWARNRGGMSKSSAVVNLSEDIFAGFNVHMRSEASPHIDALEFEKGREATFNAASNFFSKIAGGSVSVIRSRDNHLLCERIGILHSLSFYFASVAFYMSNLLVDMSIYLYVWLFILFNLAGFGPGRLAALGSSFSTEWIISMGIVSLFPQMCEMILEHGAVHAIYEAVTGFLAATFFFIFQNKNISSAMREGAVTGIAKYFFTGRPMANQHQTWKDIYITYWKSHYMPAISLGMAYLIYSVLSFQNRGEGRLPMVLVVISLFAWICTPIVFSPLPKWNLIGQDIREFNSFITGGAGTEDVDIPDVVKRGRNGTVRTLYECGLADEISTWAEQPIFMLAMNLSFRLLLGAFLAVSLPSEILDFFWIFPVVLSLSWVVVLGYFAAGLNNVFLVLSFLVWIVALPFAHFVLGTRVDSPSLWIRMPEYIISFTFFLYWLDLAKMAVLLVTRTLMRLTSACVRSEESSKHLQECVRLCFVYFFVHQAHVVQAYLVMLANTALSVVLAALDQVFCNAHTWWLLNNELARTHSGEKYMEKGQTFFELDVHRNGGTTAFTGSESWLSDSDSDETPRNGLSMRGGSLS